MLLSSSSEARDGDPDARQRIKCSLALRIRARYVASFGVAFIILLQYCLFRQYALREATWAHPTDVDQSVYLLASYETFEYQLTHGFWAGAWKAVRQSTPNGVMLPAQASFLYHFIGASRLSAFTLLFVYFAAAEAVLAWVSYWFTRSWALAFGTLFLFMLSASRFYWVGGLFDFRIDCVVASLYLIFVCLVILSKMFASRTISIACGATAALLVLFRFVAITYIGVLLGGTMCVILLLRVHKTRTGQDAGDLTARARNCMMAILALSAIAGPAILRNASEMLRYYGSHFGPEKELRQAQMRLTSAYSHLVFYPRSLWNEHLGPDYLLTAAIILTAAGVWALFRPRVLPEERIRTAVMSGESRTAVLLFTVASILVPLALFTADASKSPVVAGVVVGPLTVVVLLAVFAFVQNGPPNTRVIAVATTMLAFLAVWHEFSAISHHSRTTINRADERALLRTYSSMLAYAAEAGWKQIYIANDRLTDYTLAHNYTILHYEQTHELYPVLVTFGGGVGSVPHESAVSGIAVAQFAVLTRRFARDASTLYPFDKQMIAMEKELWAEAKKRMLLYRTLSYNGHEIAIFAKPAVRVKGTSGDWLTADGAWLIAPCKLLTGKHTFVAAGSTIFPEMISNSLRVTASLNSPAGSWPVTATVSPVTAKYAIRIDLRGADIPAEGSCEIAIAFDRYFVPKERGINGDLRRLVIQAPTDFQVE